MAHLPDPRPEIWLGGDESGGFDFAGRSGDAYFLITTVGMVGDSLRHGLEEVGAELRGVVGDPSIGRPFHAKDDTPLTRDRVFRLLATHQLMIDVSIVDKTTVPRELTSGGGHPLYTLLWYQHLAHALPGILHPANKVRLSIAEMSAYSRKQAFQSAINQATAVAYIPLLLDAMAVYGPDPPHENMYAVPALLFGYGDARRDWLLQVADYCAWAIQRKLRRDDDRGYGEIRHLIRSERVVTIAARLGADHDPAPQLVGLHSWTGLDGLARDYEASGAYRIGPADSFQALLAFQGALRTGDMATAVLHLTSIRPADVDGDWERFRTYLTAIGLLADMVMHERALAPDATAALAAWAQHQLARDEHDLLGRSLLAVALYNHGLTLGRLGADADAVRAYDSLIVAFADADEARIRATVAKAFVNRGHALHRLGDALMGNASYGEAIDRYGDEEDPAFDEPIAKARRAVTGKLPSLRRDNDI